ncbi:MAG: phosphodiester glycosidase family protein, partial [Tepidisphaeraceae bacterium]
MKLKLLVLALLVCPLVALAEFPSPRPYPAVVYKVEEIKQPVPQKIYIAAIDLTHPNVQVRVERGGDDPDGPGEWQTTLMQPTKIADREGFDVVINGDFYAVGRAQSADGTTRPVKYEGGIAAKVSGPAVTDGEKWAVAGEPRAALLIGKNGKPAVAQLTDPPSDAEQVIAGSHVIVQNGRNVAPEDKPGFIRGPHPRTAVGIADGGKTLILAVIDGRQKGEAVGMSLKETAEVMLKYGCTAAVNLDGGGSTMLGIRNPETGKMKIMNT